MDRQSGQTTAQLKQVLERVNVAGETIFVCQTRAHVNYSFHLLAMLATNSTSVPFAASRTPDYHVMFGQHHRVKFLALVDEPMRHIQGRDPRTVEIVLDHSCADYAHETRNYDGIDSWNMAVDFVARAKMAGAA